MIVSPAIQRTAALALAICMIAIGQSAVAQAPAQDPLKPQLRAILVDLFTLKREALKNQGKSPAEIRNLIEEEARKKFIHALDILPPPDGKVVFSEAQKTSFNRLLREILEENDAAPQPEKPVPEVPENPRPKTPQTVSDRIAPDFAIIARAVKNEDANLRGEAGITPETRRSRLLQYALSLFAKAADVAAGDPTNLTDAEKAQAARLVDDVIAGKSLVPIKQADSRLSTDDLKKLFDAINSKNKQLILAGSDPKTLNHRDQLIDFAKSEIAKVAPEPLKADENSEIDNLVDQVRYNAIGAMNPAVKPTGSRRATLTQEIRDRLIGLARAVNHGLSAVGLDPATRRKILVKFVIEQLGRLVGLGPLEALAPHLTTEAETIVDNILNDVLPIAPTTLSPIMPTTMTVGPTLFPFTATPMPVDPGYAPINLFRFPRCRNKFMFMPMNE